MSLKFQYPVPRVASTPYNIIKFKKKKKKNGKEKGWLGRVSIKFSLEADKHALMTALNFRQPPSTMTASTQPPVS